MLRERTVLSPSKRAPTGNQVIVCVLTPFVHLRVSNEPPDLVNQTPTPNAAATRFQDATNKKDAKPGADGGGAAGGGGRRGGDKNQDSHPAFDKPKASFPYGVKKSEMSGRKGGGGGKRH